MIIGSMQSVPFVQVGDEFFRESMVSLTQACRESKGSKGERANVETRVHEALGRVARLTLAVA